MTLKLLFNKYTFSLILALVGDRYANNGYEEATFTEAEHTKMNASGYTPTEEEQKAINNKKNVQKKLGYKAIKWYEEAKAYYFAKLAKTLEPLRDKLNTIR